MSGQINVTECMFDFKEVFFNSIYLEKKTSSVFSPNIGEIHSLRVDVRKVFGLNNLGSQQEAESQKSSNTIPGQRKRRPLRGRLLQYSIDIRDNYARLRRENAP